MLKRNPLLIMIDFQFGMLDTCCCPDHVPPAKPKAAHGQRFCEGGLPGAELLILDVSCNMRCGISEYGNVLFIVLNVGLQI
jgi:hypothetical protein